MPFEQQAAEAHLCWPSLDCRGFQICCILIAIGINTSCCLCRSQIARERPADYDSPFPVKSSFSSREGCKQCSPHVSHLEACLLEIQVARKRAVRYAKHKHGCCLQSLQVQCNRQGLPGQGRRVWCQLRRSIKAASCTLNETHAL